MNEQEASIVLQYLFYFRHKFLVEMGKTLQAYFSTNCNVHTSNVSAMKCSLKYKMMF